MVAVKSLPTARPSYILLDRSWSCLMGRINHLPLCCIPRCSPWLPGIQNFRYAGLSAHTPIERDCAKLQPQSSNAWTSPHRPPPVPRTVPVPLAARTAGLVLRAAPLQAALSVPYLSQHCRERGRPQALTSAGWGALAGLHGGGGSSPITIPVPSWMTHFSEWPPKDSPVSNCTSQTVWYWYISQALVYLVL